MGTIHQGNKHGADGDSSGDGNKNDQTHKIWPIDCGNLSPYNPEYRKGSRQILLNRHINTYTHTNVELIHSEND